MNTRRTQYKQDANAKAAPARATDLLRLVAAGMMISTAAMAFTAEAKDHAAKHAVVASSPDDASLKWGPCPPIFAKGCEVAVLSGDPAKGPSDVYLRTPPNFDLPHHFHHSAEHVLLVRGKFNVSFADGHKAHVQQGAYTLIPGQVPHSARCEQGEACVIFIAFDKPVDALLATDSKHSQK